MVFAENGIEGKVAQRVVHPAHIPFEVEAESAEISGARDGGPGGGFFGDGEDAGMAGVDDFVHLFDESDGLEIFAAAELVGEPLAFLAGIIEVEHGSDGVYAEAVNVIFVEPEEGVGEEEIADFVASVIEN